MVREFALTLPFSLYCIEIHWSPHDTQRDLLSMNGVYMFWLNLSNNTVLSMTTFDRTSLECMQYTRIVDGVLQSEQKNFFVVILASCGDELDIA